MLRLQTVGPAVSTEPDYRYQTNRVTVKLGGTFLQNDLSAVFLQAKQVFLLMSTTRNKIIQIVRHLAKKKRITAVLLI